MYNPSVHFDKRLLEFTSSAFLSTYKRIVWADFTDLTDSIAEDIAKYLRVELHHAWLSKVNPGEVIPLRRDNEFAGMQRYSILVCPPTYGHIHVIGNDYVYDAPLGGIFKWNDASEWHSTINASDTPYYIIHLLAN